MQFGDNYLNDGHLPPEIPKQTAATASILCHVGRSRCPLKCQTRRPPVVVVRDGGVLCGRCDFSCYVCVVASAAAASNERRCTNYRDAGVRLAAPRRRPRRSAAEMCRRTMDDGRWTADASACGRRSARILEIRGVTRTFRPRKFADAD